MVSLTAPYLSGFLAFREVPFLVDAVRRLREKEPGLLPQAGTWTGLRGAGRLGRPSPSLGEPGGLLEKVLRPRTGTGLSQKPGSVVAPPFPLLEVPD